MSSLLLILVGFAAIFWVEGTWAIPTFSRKYKTSCQTCHLAFPRLTSFGEAFRLNGYRMPEADEDAVKEEPIALGSEAWKRAWPDSVWPSSIPGLPPVSFRLIGRIKYDPDLVGDQIRLDFELPHEFEILMAGTFDETISYWAEVEFEEGEAEVGNAFIFYKNALGSIEEGRGLNLRIGQFDPDYIPFRNHVRSTISKPLTNSSLSDHAQGIEAIGLLTDRCKYVFGVINGTMGEGETVDNNSIKDYYLRAAYRFGGMTFNGKTPGVGGETPEDEEEQIIPTEATFAERSLTVGGFAYFGDASSETSSVAEFDRWGVDFDFRRPKFYLSGNYVRASDDLTAGGSSDTNTWFVQADVLPKPWMLGTIRYENVDPEGEDSSSKIVPSLTLIQRANLKWTLEGQIFPDDTGNGIVQLQVDFAF